MDAAQNMAHEAPDELVVDFPYTNAKQIVNPGEPAIAERVQEMVLTPNKHFLGIPVNTSYSAVHVPTNVYDGGEC